MKIIQFEDLEIWKTSLALTRDIYALTNQKEFNRDFGLRDQIRRAVVSVSSNIVEGFEKNNNNEFIRYLRIAKGSAGEVRSQLYVAHEISYITKEQLESMNAKFIGIAKQIGAFIVYLEHDREARNPRTR